VALDACTLRVSRGEVFGLLGPNGAGKTTLIRLMMGFLRPTSGTARVDGLDCYRQPVEVHRRVSYLPGEARLYRRMRGRKVLKFFAGVRARGNFAKALVIAERLDLDLSRRVAYMSTGMRQKLALAVALSADTPLLILDEPTANLDPSVRGEVMQLVAEAKQAGRTVIFSSHVLSEIEEVCDRAFILRKGRAVCDQDMKTLRRQHRIRANLAGQLPAAPGELREQLRITRGENDQVTIVTPGELSPLLAWLATLPISEVSIEPVGLRAVYDRYHAGPSNGQAAESSAERDDLEAERSGAATEPSCDSVETSE